MRAVFDSISEKIISSFQGTQLIPKKTYLSFTAIREFAAINVKPKEIRLGLDLGDEAFTEALQKSKLTGPMPRISHMIILTESTQFDNKVKQLVQQSFNRSNKK
jgi:predicted transport protein